MKFGEIVLQKRKKLNISQKELADAMQVSRALLAHYELGRNIKSYQNLRIGNVKRMSDKLNWPMEEIITAIFEMDKPNEEALSA